MIGYVLRDLLSLLIFVSLFLLVYKNYNIVMFCYIIFGICGDLIGFGEFSIN